MLTGWIDQDRKQAGLKALQGMIWDEGYRQRAFVPELYGDVLPALTQWRARGTRLGIYSSGSEQAQRLLLAHTNAGDVTSLFEHFFDTSVGEKKAATARSAGRSVCRPITFSFCRTRKASWMLRRWQNSGPPTSCGLEPMRALVTPHIPISRTFVSKDRRSY